MCLLLDCSNGSCVCVQVELAGERHRAEDQASRLEAEVEALKERLQERAESQVYGVVCV